MLQDINADIETSIFRNNTVLLGSGGALMMSCSMTNNKSKINLILFVI